MDVWDSSTAGRIQELGEAVTEIEEAYSATLDLGDDDGSVEEGLEEAGMAAVDLLGQVLRLIEELRGQGAAIAETPLEPEAILLLLANLPKLMEHFEKQAAEALAQMERVEQRFRTMAR